MEQLDQLLSARKSLSASLAVFDLQARELQHVAHTLAPVIASLQEQKAAVDKQIAQLTAQQEEFAITKELEKVPGIGPVTAATLASRLASVDKQIGPLVIVMLLWSIVGWMLECDNILECDNRARKTGRPA